MPRSSFATPAASSSKLEEPMQEVPVMEELPEPRPTYILARGAYDAPKTDANRVGRDTFAKHPDSISRKTRPRIAWASPTGSPIRTIRSPPACS